jgi:hypothetical protein
VRGNRLRDALCLALGLVILANSRPYEGLILSLPVGVALLFWMLGRNAPPARLIARRVVLPVALTLFAAGIGMAYFFWRTTGSPVRMPYQVNRATYGIAPYFIWQSPNLQQVYRHAVIRDYYVNDELGVYQRMRSIGGFVRETAIKLLVTWGFYIGPVLTIPIFTLPWILRDHRIRWLVLTGAVSFTGTALVSFFIPHYVATITGVFVALVVQGMRHLCAWRPEGKPVGKALVGATVVTSFLLVGLHTWISGAQGRGSLQEMALERTRILTQLEALPHKQLILVRYPPDHDPLQEWVYNGADIDGSKVVWARDMGAEKNYELIEYFKNRHVWLVEPNGKPARVMAYPEPVPNAWLVEPDATHRADRDVQKKAIEPWGSDASVPSILSRSVVPPSGSLHRSGRRLLRNCGQAGLGGQGYITTFFTNKPHFCHTSTVWSGQSIAPSGMSPGEVEAAIRLS